MIDYVFGRYIGNSEQGWLFLKKRFVKIIPMYWIVTLVAAFTVFLIFPQVGDPKDTSFTKTISSLLFLNPDPTLAVTWSLRHVMLFYLIVVLLFISPKFGIPILSNTWTVLTVFSM